MFPYLTRQACRYQQHLIKEVKGLFPKATHDRRLEDVHRGHDDNVANKSNLPEANQKCNRHDGKSFYSEKTKIDSSPIKSRQYKEVEVDVDL